MAEMFQFHLYNSQMHSKFFKFKKSDQHKYAGRLTSRKIRFMTVRPFFFFQNAFKLKVIQACLDFFLHIRHLIENKVEENYLFVFNAAE